MNDCLFRVFVVWFFKMKFAYFNSLNKCLLHLQINVSFQIQADKEKLLCEIDEMHAQLEKAQYNTNRFQAEKEDFQLDSERHRSTNEKLQVKISSFN